MTPFCSHAGSGCQETVKLVAVIAVMVNSGAAEGTGWDGSHSQQKEVSSSDHTAYALLTWSEVHSLTYCIG